MQITLFLIDVVLINAVFLMSFVVRYGTSVPELSFAPYRENFAFLTIIYMASFACTGVFRKRFKTSGDLLRRICSGLFLGMLFSLDVVYIFRVRWSRFPSSIFLISTVLGTVIIYVIHSLILKRYGRIKKRTLIIGKDSRDSSLAALISLGRRTDELIENDRFIEEFRIDDVRDLIKFADIDEVVVCEEIDEQNDLNLLIFICNKLKAEVFFAPALYNKLISRNLNGSLIAQTFTTFIGRKSDMEELLIRAMDVIGSLSILILTAPVVLLISILIKVTSQGPVFYTQKRAGKDGRIFTLYKFRTMVKDAEKLSGLSPATEFDPRITRIGRFLRPTRLDEMPQLLNVLKGQMSLVGPRPENLYRVNAHKALQGIRLAVKPGMTGLAQIRSFYDLHPSHKIKYDYLYIQKRNLLLNLYILTKTIPVILSKKGR